MHRRSRWLLFAVLLVAVAIGVQIASRPSADSLVRDAESALRAKDYSAARSLAEQALQLDPASVRAALIAAVAAEQRDDISAALEFYGRVPDTAESAVTARTAAGDLLLKNQRDLNSAVIQFERALQLDPDNLLAHDRLTYIFGLSGRDWEMIPHQIAVLRLSEVNTTRLYSLSLGDRLPTDPAVIREFAADSPNDPLVLGGQALAAVADQKSAEAIELLNRALEQNPELTALRLRLGMLHLNRGDEHDIAAWHTALPADTTDFPLLWVIRGLYARSTNQPEAAARCFWEALRRDPNHQSANYQLGQLLVALHREADAEPFLDRSRRLEEYVHAVFVSAFADPRDPKTARSYLACADQAHVLGLAWEAWAWQSLAAQSPQLQRSGVFGRRNEYARPSRDLIARCAADASPARALDLSASPMPVWRPVPSSVASQSGDHVTFEETASANGIDFTYYDAIDPATQGKRIFDSIGGGVAVLDYDQDGWPDLYATQRCGWPVDPNQTSQFDSLFRNRATQLFTETSRAAGIIETGYSQGATVGDFNADGFPDLYVANIGADRFFANNGDGTFTEISQQTATVDDEWSTSCVLADFSGDALPDLYVANYVETTGDIERVCRSPQGSPTTCPPGSFRAAADRFYLNRGDGSFADISRESGVHVAEGRGLGVVAADLNGSGRLSLFVANDQDPNFLFVHQSQYGTPRFIDESLANGVALSGEGRAQAGMGIAAGDSNDDGQLDLYLTTFTGEQNTLFQGLGHGLFADGTRAAGLIEPSVQMLGFGTQFLDADLDGRLDLIVANGHIDDRSNSGELYRMPPQFYANLGGGRFAERPARSLGPYFEGRYLGRGLARLDWNRDGLDDAAISHLDAPLALLTNTTSQHGHWVSIRLVGAESERDAVGATVTVISGEQSIVRQLTAGDGFHASNDRTLNIGLGQHSQPVEIHVHWPSGAEQNVSGVEVDRPYVFVEGRLNPLALPAR